MNRYDAYKDRLRTIEILARQRFNARKNHATGSGGDLVR
jgi:hypothetical protein